MFYDVTHSCGHIERVSLYGPGKVREWRIKQLEQELCPECRAVEFANKCEEDAKKAKELELPVLSGSEKQVAWAETIRIGFVNAYENYYAQSDPGYSEYVEAALRETRAKWWIDNRDCLWSDSIVIEIINKAIAAKENSIPTSVAGDMMLLPAEKKQDVVITLKSTSDHVIAICGCRNEVFSEIVKGLGYRWCQAEKCWKLKITVSRGYVEDRMAELGSKLLDSGFPISVSDEIVRQKIELGEYEPIYHRWITRTSDEFLIRWERSNEDIYKAARAVPCSRWNSDLQGITIPANQYKAVLDLANSFDFKKSPGAEELIAIGKEAEKQALIISPTIRHAEKPKSNGLGDILNSSRDILPDLIDDDP